jgi:dienelactone hydrolase
MASDPQVDLIFSHFTPRYVATGVDPNDLQRLIARIDRWADWCRLWSEEAARHEALGRDAAEHRRPTTAGEAYLRAAIYYHYAKHMFGEEPDQFRAAHEAMLRCYLAAARYISPTMERFEIPFEGARMAAYLRRPTGSSRPKVAILLPGLDAAKEELHAWSDAFLARGLATVTLDGPGQGETSFQLPIRHDWGRVIGAVIDVLERRRNVDAGAVAVVGQSLGAIYAPLAAAGEPRIKACVANCGPFDFGRVLPQLPTVSQELFRIRAHAASAAEALAIAGRLSLANCAAHIRCPLLVVFGAGDRIVPPSEGEMLARAAAGPTDFVVYPEGNHVCFNIPYKFRPLTADWTAEKL